MMTTKRFYSSKFYPVNYDTRTIYNDPQRNARDCDLNSPAYRDKGTVGIPGFRLNNFANTYSAFTVVNVADKAIYREANAKRKVDNYEREFGDDSRRGTAAALSGRHSSPVGIDDPEDHVYDLAFASDSLTSAVTLTPTQYQLLARISERGLTGDASGSDYMALEGAGLIAIAGTDLIVTEAGQAALTFSFGGYSVVIRQVGWGDDHSPFHGDDTWQAWIEEPENRFASWVPLADLVASKAATEAAA